MDEPRTDECRWCHVPIREVDVLVGEAPGRIKTLWIGVEPDVHGHVIVRSDGAWRQLAPFERGRAVAPAYLIHNGHTCDPARRPARVDPPRFAPA